KQVLVPDHDGVVMEVVDPPRPPEICQGLTIWDEGKHAIRPCGHDEVSVMQPRVSGIGTCGPVRARLPSGPLGPARIPAGIPGTAAGRALPGKTASREYPRSHQAGLAGQDPGGAGP